MKKDLKKTSGARLNDYRRQLISLEGISGVGKTYLLDKALAEMKEKGINVYKANDLSEYDKGDIGNEILKILASTDDKFFRLGFPKMETFLLMAMKLYEYDKWIEPALKNSYNIIEDRSFDTIALYSAVIMNMKNNEDILVNYQKIFSTINGFRMAPSMTIYFKDDFDKCIERAENRNGEKYQPDEKELLYRVWMEYDRVVQLDKKRFCIIDRSNISEKIAISQLTEICIHYFDQNEQ